MLSSAETEMVALKSCEILEELKKLGIDRPSDVLEILNEYTDYCICTDGDPESETGTD